MSGLREIVLDTETTGLSPKDGDRIIEIGCVELIDKVRTGNNYHAFINPQREVNPAAFKVHGISTEFLADKPIFSKVVKEFLEYLGTNSKLIIHNAPFDMGFLNHELGLLGYPEIKFSRAIDTLPMARKKFPGAPASLDALCRRFDISLDSRDKHGALIDAELLALVYIELTGGTQSRLDFKIEKNEATNYKQAKVIKSFREPREFKIKSEDLAAHKEFISTINNALWNKNDT